MGGHVFAGPYTVAQHCRKGSVFCLPGRNGCPARICKGGRGLVQCQAGADSTSLCLFVFRDGSAIFGLRHLRSIAWNVSQSLVARAHSLANVSSIWLISSSMGKNKRSRARKNPETIAMVWGPCHHRRIPTFPGPRGDVRPILKAGLLTSGSFFHCAFPIQDQWHEQWSSPVTAAGPFPICTGFPYYVLATP